MTRKPWQFEIERRAMTEHERNMEDDFVSCLTTAVDADNLDGMCAQAEFQTDAWADFEAPVLTEEQN